MAWSRTLLQRWRRHDVLILESCAPLVSPSGFRWRIPPCIRGRGSGRILAFGFYELAIALEDGFDASFLRDRIMAESQLHNHA